MFDTIGLWGINPRTDTRVYGNTNGICRSLAHLPFSEFGNYHPFVFWIMLERCVVFLSGNGTEASDWSVPLPLFSSESLRTSPGTFWLTALNMPGPITQPTHAATSSAHWGRNNTYSLSQTDTGMTLTARRTFRGEIGGSIKMRHTYKKNGQNAPANISDQDECAIYSYSNKAKPKATRRTLNWRRAMIIKR